MPQGCRTTVGWGKKHLWLICKSCTLVQKVQTIFRQITLDQKAFILSKRSISRNFGFQTHVFYQRLFFMPHHLWKIPHGSQTALRWDKSQIWIVFHLYTLVHKKELISRQCTYTSWDGIINFLINAQWSQKAVKFYKYSTILYFGVWILVFVIKSNFKNFVIYEKCPIDVEPPWV